MRALRTHVTYANVMSTIAVFAVLAGGGAYAASKIGPKQIKRDAVRSKHLKDRAVKARDLAPSSVRPRHLAGGAVTGDKLAGAAVTSSKLGTIIRRSEQFTVPAGQFGSRTTGCGPGETLLSGGGEVTGPAASTVSIVQSHPDFEMTQQTWGVRALNSGVSDATVRAVVFCLQ